MRSAFLMARAGAGVPAAPFRAGVPPAGARRGCWERWWSLDGGLGGPCFSPLSKWQEGRRGERFPLPRLRWLRHHWPGPQKHSDCVQTLRSTQLLNTAQFTRFSIKPQVPSYSCYSCSFITSKENLQVVFR